MRTVVELIFFFRNLSIWWRKLAIFSPTYFSTLIQKMTKKKWTKWKLHHSFSKSEWSWTWLNLKHLLIRFFRLHQIEIVKHFGCKIFWCIFNWNKSINICFLPTKSLLFNHLNHKYWICFTVHVFERAKIHACNGNQIQTLQTKNYCFLSKKMLNCPYLVKP